MKHLKNKSSNRQSWPITALAAAIVVGIAGFAQANSATSVLNRKPIGDLEIYTPAKEGTATIFMMLDTSGSMDKRSIRDDYGSSYDNCSEKSIDSEKIKAVIYKRKVDADGVPLRDADGNTIKDLDNREEVVEFTPKGCTNYYGTVRYSRMMRLQIALIELLADEVYIGSISKRNFKDTGSLSDDYEVGLGNFSPSSSKQIGVVLSPTKALTAEQRIELIEKIKELKAVSWTPTAHALAESGAYMMGTTTASDTKVVGERRRKGSFGYEYRQCDTNDNVLSFDSNSGLYVYACNTFSNKWNNNRISGDLIDNTYYSTINADSGFRDAVETAVKTGENNYISPLNPKECSGNGIYLLTDGAPNKSSDPQAKAVMNTSLSYSDDLSVSSCSGLTGGSEDGAWGCMADYAALLRNTANNPLGLPIKTATVGFGKDFEGLTGKRTITVNKKEIDVVDCDSGRSVNQNTRNLCKLGERRGDDEVKTFGDGGFYYTEESADIAASIVDFSASLVQTINTAPSGTITIPDDPYRAGNQLPYAYLPMLDPDIASAASLWRGNLKKYALDKGTLYGNNNRLLYKDVAGSLNEKTQDIWQTADYVVEGNALNNDIAAGGIYAQLSAPGSEPASLRTLYVEDYKTAEKKIPMLRKLGVGNDGKPVGFEQLKDTDTYTQLNKRRLLSFLGFESVLTKDGQPSSEDDVEDLVLSKPTKETKVLGGIVHSTPVVMSYNAVLDDKGRITDTREDYVLFGSMDGALHVVHADSGKEAGAIIPRKMLINQPKALVSGSIKDKEGEPYFGIDAPWLVTTDYKYDLEAKRVTVDTSDGKGVYAYGGLRMGGEGLYGLDITLKTNPKVLFTIDEDGLVSSTPAKSNKIGFERIGQIWSKPTPAKIRRGADADPIDVLVFAGGYDMSYEDDSYVPTSDDPAKGNTIYMINAQTGELIWSTSAKATDSKDGKKAPDMIHSITGEITVLDRDNDGLMDHLYAADLGGQVFRADFENARPAKFGFTKVNSFSNKAVTRILNVAPSTNDYKKYAYRFYERPVVSFYRNEGLSGEQVANNGKIFAVINVISGNRSAPLSTLRNNNDYANRVYGIIDNDITHVDLNKTGFSPTLINKTESDLVNLAQTLGNEPTETDKNNAKVDMVKGDKHGWYYPLTRFDGYNNVRYNKGMGDSVVINSLLYTTVYNPDKQYGNVASCAAKISGGSERQLYCLPYGICMDDDSISGTGGYIPAGQGIQELTLGAYNKDNTDIKVLIGTTTITDRIEEAKRSGYGEDGNKKPSNIKDLYPGEEKRPTEIGGDGTAAEFLFNERYTLQPRAWYHQNQKKEESGSIEN